MVGLPRTRRKEMEFNFIQACSREYWITQKGEKVFAHEFEDEHLANTIRYLHKQCRNYRLEEARRLCCLVHRTGNEGVNVDTYYHHYRRQMDAFLDDMSDKQWLKLNSKIYTLLVEEADYRKIDYSDKPPTKVKYTSKMPVRFNYTSSSGRTYNFTF
jgi:hypothetical protein